VSDGDADKLGFTPSGRDLPEIVVDTLAKVGLVVVSHGLAAPALMVYDAVRAGRAQRFSLTIDELFAKVDPNVVVDLISRSPAFGELVAEVLETASRSSFEPRRRLLARVLVNAATDEACIDESAVMAGVLHELDAPHIRALERIRAAFDTYELSAEQQDDLASRDPTGERGYEADCRSDAAFEVSKREPAPVITALIRTGALAQPMVLGNVVGSGNVTAFGRALLNDLRRVFDEGDILTDASDDD
jgi:hypothetical protein